MKKIRTAVVGFGHLGKIHARLLNTIDDARLTAIVEPSAEGRKQAAELYNAQIVASVDELGPLDAAIVAAPTHSHQSAVESLIERGAHVLVEKPIALSVKEADSMIAVAKKHQKIVQVGHVERFNPALAAAAPHITRPKYIEATRTSGYTFRSTDVGVVLDLMIHDIDVVLSLVGGTVTSVDALGISVFGPHEDIAQARLKFDNGCVANLTASRCSFAPERMTKVFAESGYAEINFGDCSAKVIRVPDNLADRSLDVHALPEEQKQLIRENLFGAMLPIEDLPVERGNAILDEQNDFVTSIRSRRSPVVCGRQGRNALAIAERIIESIANHQWNGIEDAACGPHAVPAPSVLTHAAWSPETREQPIRKAG